jgi:hypothetical protein
VACPARPRLGRVCWVRPSAERKRLAWPGGDRPRPVTDGHGPTGPEWVMACWAKTADAGPRRGTGRATQPGHRPSRGNGAGIPVGDLLAPAQAGFFPRQPRRDTAVPKRWPSRGPRRPEPTGNGLTRPRTSLFRPREAKIAICRPEGVNSGQKKIYAGREATCRPGECRSRPRTLQCWPGHKYAGRGIKYAGRDIICWHEEVECRTGDADADPGQPYAGPGELMSARENEEDLQCSEAMLMMSPRADEEDPVRMCSYQRLDLPHGGRQISSW